MASLAHPPGRHGKESTPSLGHRYLPQSATQAPPPSLENESVMSDIDVASVVLNASGSPIDISFFETPRVPPPIVALLSHPSERLFSGQSVMGQVFEQPVSDQATFRLVKESADECDGDSNHSIRHAPIQPASTPDVLTDDRQAVPCHECGAIVQIYRKRTWYAIVRGLEVGVRHTWYAILYPPRNSVDLDHRKATRPAVAHDLYNLSGIIHFAFHTKAEAEEKFTEELLKGNVRVLNLSEVARPRK